MPFLLSKQRMRTVVQKEKWSHATFKLRVWRRKEISVFDVRTKIRPKVDNEITYEKGS